MTSVLTVALAIALAVSASACGKGRAGDVSTNFAGTWDVTYDDAIEVDVRLGEDVQRVRIGEQGGRVVIADAGVDFTIDCARPELVCPAEVWPRELRLAGEAGDALQQDGDQVVRWLSGLGSGRCAIKQGSILTAEVMSINGAHAVQPEAVALTSGRVRTVMAPDCTAALGTLPPDAEVVLTTGFSAAKR
ncbi:MAG: hypothetical protein ABW252_19800 [Polyangiales bacterium]